MSSNQPTGNKISYQDIQAIAQETEQLRSNHSFLLQQSDLLLQTLEDLEDAKKTLQEISTRKVDEEVLIPLGSRILMKFKIVEKENVIYRIGSNIMQDLSITDVQTKLDGKITEIRNGINNVRNQLFQIENMIAQRENFLNQISYSNA